MVNKVLCDIPGACFQWRLLNALDLCYFAVAAGDDDDAEGGGDEDGARCLVQEVVLSCDAGLAPTSLRLSASL